MSKEKSSLLNKWLDRKKKSVQPSVKSQEENKYPLSYNQQGLYFLYKSNPQNPFYNYLDTYQFEGVFNLEHFISAFDAIVKRHEVFRTKFKEENGIPFQFISDKGQFQIIQHDLSKNKLEEQTAEKLIIKDARKPFDLETGNLLRLSIVKLSNDQYQIGIITHHIIIDKWSVGLLREEVSTIYRSLVKGTVDNLQKLNYKFGQYTNEITSKPVDPKKLSYWKNQLKDVNSEVDLPFDYSRPFVPTFSGCFQHHACSEQLNKRIKDLSSEYNLTPFVILLTVYQCLLYKYGNKNSVPVGVPFTNKNDLELEKIVGYFDETVVINTKVENQSFSEILKSVQKNVFDAFDNKDVPFELLIKELNPERTGNLNPFFQTMFIYHKVPILPSFGEEVTFQNPLLDYGVSKFDLTLFVEERGDDFNLIWEYAKDLFKPETISRINQHFLVLLDHLTKNVHKPLDEISIMGQNETALINSNSQEVIDKDQSICSLINSKSKEYADHTAVVCGIHNLSHAELTEASNRVAGYLQNNGFTKGNIIGIYMDRSVDTIVAILGILKAGCAYLPLDPNYPMDRIQHMLEDSKVVSVLYHHKTKTSLQEGSYQKVDIEEVLQLDFPFEINDNPSPKDLAYVIYTSGSSGKPKGVGISHGNLYSSTKARLDYYGNDRVNYLLFPSFSFDSSVAGIFWSLCVGGKLVITESRDEQDLEKVSNLIIEEEITHTLLLPSLYDALLKNAKEAVSIIKSVVLAGESLPKKLTKLHLETLSNTRLFNEYGPTEGTVWSSVYEITEPIKQTSVPIGKAPANTYLRIFDHSLNQVPVGIRGEIYIGGSGVSDFGYLNQQKLNDEKFIIDPANGKRLYKTGDLGLRIDSGDILFLGRKDNQVKIRGHRVEMDEINRLVADYEKVLDATVAIKKVKIKQDENQALLDLLNSLDDQEADNILTFVESQNLTN